MGREQTALDWLLKLRCQQHCTSIQGELHDILRIAGSPQQAHGGLKFRRIRMGASRPLSFSCTTLPLPSTRLEISCTAGTLRARH